MFSFIKFLYLIFILKIPGHHLRQCFSRSFETFLKEMILEGLILPMYKDLDFPSI